MRKDDWKQKGLEQGRLNEELQQTKVGKNIPNDLKMYQMALKCTKWPYVKCTKWPYVKCTKGLKMYQMALKCTKWP
jgi:hypothetical protein